jgi:hypothetical protein
VTAPGDRGLQIERTGLAWRRTSLGVAVGALLCLRVLPPRLGAVGVLLAVLGLAWSADLALIGARRLRDAGAARASAPDAGETSTARHPRPSRPDRTTVRDGAVMARTAGVAGLVVVVALVTTVVLAARPG